MKRYVVLGFLLIFFISGIAISPSGTVRAAGVATLTAACTVTNSVAQVQLNWNIPSDAIQNVVMKRISTGSFTDNAPFNFPMNQTSYTDGAVQPGNTYVYRYKPTAGVAVESTANCTLIVPPPPPPPPPVCAAPMISAKDAVNVTTGSADLQANVNPGAGNTVIVHFEYGTAQSFGSVTASQSFSGDQVVRVAATVTGLQPSTTYYYRLISSNPCGTSANVSGDILTFTTDAQVVNNPPPPPPPPVSEPPPPPPPPVPPEVSITANGVASALTVSYGSVVRVNWNSSNASACNVDPTGHIGPSGSFFTSPLKATVTFTVFCQGEAGDAEDSVRVTVLAAPIPPKPTGGKPAVETLEVNDLTKTYVMFPGTVHPSGARTEAWFEYGVTDALGSSTAKTAIAASAGATVIATKVGAQSGTGYFYRIVAQNSFGITRGGAKQAVAAGDASFRIEPASKSLRIGEQVQFAAYYDADGAGSLPPDEVTRSVLWVPANPSVVTSFGSGLFRGEGLGTTSVTAFYSGPGKIARADDPNALKAQVAIAINASTEPDFAFDTSSATSTAAPGGSSWWKWLIWILLITALGAGGYFLFVWFKRRRDEVEPDNAPSSFSESSDPLSPKDEGA